MILYEQDERELREELTRLSKEFGIKKPKLLLSRRRTPRKSKVGIWQGCYFRGKITIFVRFLLDSIDLYQAFYHEFKHYLQHRKANWDGIKAFGSQEVPHRKRPHEIEAKAFAKEQEAIRQALNEERRIY